jgi:xylulose-5-phosphate/fructose-6-phosphate phosphoketolase
MTTTTLATAPLASEELRRIDAYWRAANYLSVGQIYLLDNPLLRRELRSEDVKPRLLGHWGTTPGLNFIYRAPESRDQGARCRRDLHLRTGARRPRRGGQRVPRGHVQRDLSEYLSGRGRHEVAVPPVSRFPGGIPSHARPKRRARFTRAENSGIRSCTRTARFSTIPICSRCCVVGDGEAETGRSRRVGTRTSSSIPRGRRGAADPAPQRLQRSPARPFSRELPHDELVDLFTGTATNRAVCQRHEPDGDAPVDGRASTRARRNRIQTARARRGFRTRPRWPMIVFEFSPRAGPARSRRRQADRGHVPRASSAARRVRENRTNSHMLEEWMRSYRPEELFDEGGKLHSRSYAELAPAGDRRMGANPHANGGLLLKDLRLPDFREYASRCPSREASVARPRACSATFCAT